MATDEPRDMSMTLPPAPSEVVLTGAARYVAFCETMTLADVDRLAEVVTEDIHFADPFNDVIGIQALTRVFRGMFRDIEGVRFRITHRAFDGDVCFLRWVFSGRVKALRADWEFVGMSDLRFAADGRVREHIDHWDAGRHFHERLPGLGWVARALRRMAGHG